MQHPEDVEARQGMAVAAYHAGIAINQVGVGNVHAIAHQLGARYGIPHGQANALALPHVLKACLAEAETALAELFSGVAGDQQVVVAEFRSVHSRSVVA